MTKRRAPSEGELALQLFDQLLPGKSWHAWRVVLQAFYGLPMTAAATKLFRAATGRTRSLLGRAARLLALIGRRGGKSRFVSFLGTFLATCVRYDHVLAPGEIGVLQIMAPSRLQSGVIFSYIVGFLDALPSLQSMIIRRTADEIDLLNHGNVIRIAVTTASFKMPRGFTCIGFIGDESAFFEDASSANPASEIWRAILPSLATTNGPAILITTPYSRSGLAYDLFDKFYGRDDSDTLVWCADSRTMHPRLDAAIVDRAYADDPESAASEFGRDGQISFRSDLQNLFDGATVRKCVRDEPRELPPQDGFSYAVFCDTASGSDESYTASLAHRDGYGKVIVDVVREWSAPFDPLQVTGEVCRLARRYRCTTVVGDRFAAGFVAGAFAREGITYRVSERTKSQLFMDFAALINSQSVEIPADPVLVNQLLGLQRRVARGGRDSVDHKSGKKDDKANAVAGVATLAASSTSKVAWPTSFTTCLIEGRTSWWENCFLLGGDVISEDPSCRPCEGLRAARQLWATHVARTPAEDVQPLQVFTQRHFSTNRWMAERALRNFETAMGL